MNVPSAHLTLEDQLKICREARDAARRGIGVVVTHGSGIIPAGFLSPQAARMKLLACLAAVSRTTRCAGSFRQDDG